MSGRCVQITPFIPVGDLDRALNFYTGILGFELGFKADNYAFVRRDAAAIRLIVTGAGKDLDDPNSQTTCYIDVQGIDDLYERLKPQLDTLGAGRVRAPFNQDYGQREFHVIDEDVTLLFFGEAIKS